VVVHVENVHDSKAVKDVINRLIGGLAYFPE